MLSIFDIGKNFNTHRNTTLNTLLKPTLMSLFDVFTTKDINPHSEIKAFTKEVKHNLWTIRNLAVVTKIRRNGTSKSIHSPNLLQLRK